MPDYYDLGNYRRLVSTQSTEAQLWFNRGLVWGYAFYHEEAIRCFERAVAADSDCAMAHWGIAYASGPNYNKPWEAFDDIDLAQSLASAYQATRAALACSASASPVEEALVHALAARYAAAEACDDLSAWNLAYAEAMRKVYAAHPDDLDVAALFAEALMNVTPWALWDLSSGKAAAGSHTPEAIEVLERTLESDAGRQHPGVLHMYIHLMEMSPHPERALHAADWLRGLVPDAGHLEHMPTHIDVLCGNYRDVVVSNSAAMRADRKAVDRDGSENFYALYRSHNIHFKLYGAMFLGQQQVALQAADELVASLPEKLLRVELPPLANWLEGFVPMKVHVLIRFGRWQELIDAPLPEDHQLFCTTTAMAHYGKGVALAATGAVDAADAARERFREAVLLVPPTRTVFNNTCLDILAIAAAMLDGEIDYRRGRYDSAFAHLRRSIELDDGLPYDEPWGWMQPTRHAYGALLLEQGHVEAAEAVYRADLGLGTSLARAYQHPENVWSLHGLHECLVRGGKTEEAIFVKQRLDLARARTDVPIHSSCFCRLTHATPAAGPAGS